MPVLKVDTAIDSKGRLRSYTIYDCSICGVECKERNDKFRQRKGLCRECVYQRNSKRYQENADFEKVATNIMFDRLNKRYSKKGLICNLSTEELYKLLKGSCHYCGNGLLNKMEYKQKHFTYNFFYNGLDRIDSKKGYIRGNVVSCCKKCNLAKSDMEYKEFISHIERIYKHIICQ
jgi:5-methylcytosine-specific restriction endonuclease McrA